MSVRPHPTKHKKKPNETWWYIDIGRGKSRERIPFKGSYEEACDVERSLRYKKEPEPVYNARLKELVLPFLKWYKTESSPRTIRDIRYSIDNYFVPHFGSYRPDQLTLNIINDFRAMLLEKGLKRVTINKHINYLSSVVKWGVENRKCEPLQFSLPRYPKKQTFAPQKKPLTAPQLDDLYKHIQPHYRLLFLLMSDMGLRQEEAMKLKANNVDLEHQLIMFSGKGNKKRTVPFMSDRFEEELGKVIKDKDSGYLVVNPVTKKPYATIRKELERAAKKAKLSHVNHHLLRHTFSTLCAERGMNPHVLQRILGHSSIETTNKIYTNISQDFIGEEVRRLRQVDTHRGHRVKTTKAKILKLKRS